MHWSFKMAFLVRRLSLGSWQVPVRTLKKVASRKKPDAAAAPITATPPPPSPYPKPVINYGSLDPPVKIESHEIEEEQDQFYVLRPSKVLGFRGTTGNEVITESRGYSEEELDDNADKDRLKVFLLPICGIFCLLTVSLYTPI